MSKPSPRSFAATSWASLAGFKSWTVLRYLELPTTSATRRSANADWLERSGIARQNIVRKNNEPRRMTRSLRLAPSICLRSSIGFSAIQHIEVNG